MPNPMSDELIVDLAYVRGTIYVAMEAIEGQTGEHPYAKQVHARLAKLNAAILDRVEREYLKRDAELLEPARAGD